MSKDTGRLERADREPDVPAPAPPDPVAQERARQETRDAVRAEFEKATGQPVDRGAVTADRLGIDLNRLERVPSERGLCFKPEGGANPSTAEIRLGGKVSEQRGEALIFPPLRNQAGVDGFFRESGQPVQLKSLQGAADKQADRMVQKANRAHDAAVRSGWSDVAVHIEAPLITKDQASGRWTEANRRPSPRDMSAGAVGDISVHCVDGSVQLPVPGRHDREG